VQSFNVLSIFVFFGIFSTLGGLVATLYYRRLDLSAQYWAIATLGTGLSILATVFRETLPPLLSYSIPIGVNVACYVLMGHGLAVLGNNPTQPSRFVDRLLYGTLAFITLLELVRRFAGPQAALIVTSLGFGVVGLWSSAQAQAQYLRTGFIFALWLRWALYALGVIQLMRLQGAFTGLAASAFVQDAVNLTIYSAVFVIGLLRYMFYVAIRLQEKVALASQAAKLVQMQSIELVARNAFIASALREAPVACLVADAHDNVLVGNKEAERLLGKPLPTLGKFDDAPVKMSDLFVALGFVHETDLAKPRTYFSRNAHAGNARCISVQGQVFPDHREAPQRVFILRDEPLNTQQAADIVQADLQKTGCSLLLARHDGTVIAASAGWLEMQRECNLATSAGLWEKLDSLRSTPAMSSVLSKAAATKEGASKALQQARKRVTQDERSSSAFIRLGDGRSCDVLFDPIGLSDQAEKALLVEVRVRGIAAQQLSTLAKTFDDEPSDGLLRSLQNNSDLKLQTP